MSEPQLLLFGTPELQLDGATVTFVAERRFQLLAYLALSGGWVERDRLAGLFWPEHDNAAARRNVRKIVYRARESDWLRGLETQGESLRWRIAHDVDAFREAIAQGRAAAAIDLYRGPLLTGLDDAGNPGFTTWLDARRASLHVQWRDTALAALASMPPADRAALAIRLHDDDPFDERAVLACLTALREDRRPTQAQTLFRDYSRRLAVELGVEPSVQVREAAQAWLSTGPAADGRQGTAAAPVPAGAPPAAKDAFIGRRIELQELRSLLLRPDCRVVTVFGPGGIGKSRFAREACAQLGSSFVGDARWIALEDLDTDAAVLARLAREFGAPVNDSGDPVAQIAAQCRDRDLLLLFDNAEHIASLAALLQRLLAACPRLRLLITSRARVGLPGEWLLPLTGLAVPDADSRDPDAATAFDAVRLFDLRARTVRPDFDLPAHLPAVISIVERVEGLPLAIELAAAWVRLLPPPEIARDLQRSFELLQLPPHAQSATPRHDNVRAVFDHSWNLLAPSERDALARVTVFRGGFRRDAAAAVAGTSLAVLASLVDKSLLGIDERGRFGLHPLVACFAAERLGADAAVAAQCALRHATYWATWLDERASMANRIGAPWVAEVTTELPNSEAAWRHAAKSARPDLAALMLPALLAYHSTSGRWSEGCSLLGEALVDESDDRTALDLRMRLLTALASLHYHRGDLHETESLSRAGLDLARRLDHRDTVARSLVHLGISLTLRGHAARALPFLEEALGHARQTHDRNRIANALFNVAYAERCLGHYGRAMALNDEAVALWREVGNADGVACGMNATGNLLRIAGRFVDARTALEASLSLCLTHGLAARTRHVRMTLGHTLIQLGEKAAAREHLEFSLRESEASGQLPMQILAQLQLARLDLAESHHELAHDRCRWIARTARARGMDGLAMEALALFAQCCELRGDRGSALRLRRLLGTSVVLDRAERDDVLRRLAATSRAGDEAPVDGQGLEFTFDEAIALLDANPA